MTSMRVGRCALSGCGKSKCRSIEGEIGGEVSCSNNRRVVGWKERLVQYNETMIHMSRRIKKSYRIIFHARMMYIRVTRCSSEFSGNNVCIRNWRLVSSV